MPIYSFGWKTGKNKRLCFLWGSCACGSDCFPEDRHSWEVTWNVPGPQTLQKSRPTHLLKYPGLHFSQTPTLFENLPTGHLSPVWVGFTYIFNRINFPGGLSPVRERLNIGVPWSWRSSHLITPVTSIKTHTLFPSSYCYIYRAKIYIWSFDVYYL